MFLLPIKLYKSKCLYIYPFQCSSCTKGGAAVLRPHRCHNQNKRSSSENVTAVTAEVPEVLISLSYDRVSEMLLLTDKCNPHLDYAVSLPRCHDLCFIRENALPHVLLRLNVMCLCVTLDRY